MKRERRLKAYLTVGKTKHAIKVVVRGHSWHTELLRAPVALVKEKYDLGLAPFTFKIVRLRHKNEIKYFIC